MPESTNIKSQVRRSRSEPLGQIMIEEGILTTEQLEKALKIQQRSGGHLGRILVEMDIIREQQLAEALAIQWGLPQWN